MTNQCLRWTLLPALSLLAGVAFGGGTVIVTTNGGITHLGPPGNGFNTFQSMSSSGLGSATDTVSGSAQGSPASGGPVSTSGTAIGTATDGLLQAYASVNEFVSPWPFADGAYNGATAYAETKSSWDDILTINAPGVPAHSALTLHGDLLVEGAQLGTPFTLASYLILGTGIGPGPNSSFASSVPCGNEWCGTLLDGVAWPGQVGFSSIPVTIHTFAGAATALHYFLDVDAIADVTVTNRQPATSAVATTDFGHTVGWGGVSDITVDATGASLTGYTLASVDGFDYSHAVSPIPEPETYLTLLAGLGLLGLAARRQRPPARC